MSEQQVLRYLQLVDRRVHIIINSGIGWKPEFVPELEEIDREIAGLRKVIEAAKRVSRANGQPPQDE